jgi:RNA polymerase sigma-70 factor (ECF subfamily)
MDIKTSVTWLDALATAPTEDDRRRLYDLYQPLLRAQVARMGVRALEADDLVHDVHLIVLQKVGKFDRRHQGAFRAWLRKILTNRVRSYFREQNVHATALGGSDFLRLLDELEDPASALSLQWDREHDEHFVRKLMRLVQRDVKPPTWEAFRRQVLEGEPAAQVAEQLGLSLNVVLLAKSRVLKRLREEAAGFVE